MLDEPHEGTSPEVECFCPDCGGPMERRRKPKAWRGGSKWVYLCSDFPACPGKCSATPDGDLHGQPASQRVRTARREAHDAFDPLWQTPENKITRMGAYRWLANRMRLAVTRCHFGQFDETQCRLAIKIIKEHSPLQVFRWINRNKRYRKNWRRGELRN